MNTPSTIYKASPSGLLNYYPFGMIMKERSSSSGAYRYGHNGQESDSEITGAWGDYYTAEFWMMDTRLQRRWERYPVIFEWESPYAIFHNNPIYLSDPKGDSSQYRDVRGNLLHSSQDKLPNAIIIIPNKNLQVFNEGLKTAKEKKVENSDEANELARKIGMVYQIEEYSDFLNYPKSVQVELFKETVELQILIEYKEELEIGLNTYIKAN